ncbi:PadR family transcriptional regulator [Glutamicibacter endophyticus]
MDQVQKWPSGWLKASLAICVLRTISLHGGTYGHEIIGFLSSYGLGTVGGGTLYPLLRRLVDDQLVETSWVEGDHGPSRKTYRITSEGTAFLRTQTKMWCEFTAVTNHLLDEEKL